MEYKVGWVEVELGQLCDVVRGASPRPMGDPRYFKGEIPFIKIGDITKISGKTIFDSEIHVNEEGAKKSRLCITKLSFSLFPLHSSLRNTKT